MRNRGVSLLSSKLVKVSSSKTYFLVRMTMTFSKWRLSNTSWLAWSILHDTVLHLGETAQR
jgi:hypothetical protein